jgi:hypothetical protein
MDLSNEEFDLFLNSLITQLTMKPTKKEMNNFDFSKVNYNDFYKDNAEKIIRQKLNIKLNDPYINLIIKEQAKLHNLTEQEVIEKIMLKKHAIKKFVSIETIGKLALFLASDAAATITGTSIPVDSGWTAQ